ncbi:MAG: Plastidic atp adp transporter [candidate division TM6 bacterium GW2011_GWF2_37_49]|nr:MAG: Plastidic atp adp transporter [candidate division TM6 bacterium GW2011_GWF2_37_49]
MLSRLLRFFWGELTSDELKKFGMLACTYLFIIGTYWLMRPLKDAIFMRVVGKSYLPVAKIISVLTMIPLILIYSKLVDMFQKHKLFYILFIFYGLIFLTIAYSLGHPSIGLSNTIQGKERLIGWAFYLGIESFGSLAIALFWSFVASTCDTKSAKKGYSLIIFGAQFGSVAGPFLACKATIIGMQLLVLIVACGILIVPVLIKILWHKYPHFFNEIDADKKTSKTSSGPIQGLRLLFANKYLVGILGLVTLYEIIGTIIDYQMKFMANESFNSVEVLTEFLGAYGFYANLLALLFTLVGTNFFIRRFGLVASLVAYPLTVGLVVIIAWLQPTLYAFFAAMIAIKGFSYALNKPCVEIMYIPTSKDVKFKAKSWIDVFGSRLAKAFGAGINAFFTEMSSLLFFGSLISLGIVGIWIVTAFFVGKKNQQLVRDNQIIE